MNDRDCWTCDAMEKYGGSFVKALANAARAADATNLLKIKTAFPEEWGKYEEMGQKLEQESGE